MSTFPPLSFVCPIPWNEMRRDERERFCSKCQRTVVNLSLLTQDQRAAVLAEAQAQPGGLCVAYYRRLNGEFVTAEAPLTKNESRRVVQFGVTALSAAALAVVAHQAPKILAPVAEAGSMPPAAFASSRDRALAEVRDALDTLGERLGGKPRDKPVLLSVGRMICPAPVTPPAPPAPAVSGAPIAAGGSKE